MVKLTGRDETACAIFTNACGKKEQHGIPVNHHHLHYTWTRTCTITHLEEKAYRAKFQKYPPELSCPDLQQHHRDSEQTNG
jgi:hypothetical protein